MPHLSGVFDEFPDLDKVSTEEIASGLKKKLEVHALNNFFGNRLLYPQAVSLNMEDLQIDLAILRQAIKLKPSLVYEPQANRIVIPIRFIERFPVLEWLIQAVIEGINPKGEHLIYIKNQNQGEGKPVWQLIGSVVSPLNPQKLSSDEKTVSYKSIESEKSLLLGQLNIIKSQAKELKITLGNEEFTVAGGEAGIFIDLRKGNF